MQLLDRVSNSVRWSVVFSATAVNCPGGGTVPGAPAAATGTGDPTLAQKVRVPGRWYRFEIRATKDGDTVANVTERDSGQLILAATTPPSPPKAMQGTLEVQALGNSGTATITNIVCTPPLIARPPRLAPGSTPVKPVLHGQPHVVAGATPDGRLFIGCNEGSPFLSYLTLGAEI
eukprot:SAG31_NODE_18278_length_641_cov_1.332103_1_plen_174_part_01